ncbi:NAD(P)H-dependent oxidoreductase [Limosilactobacillus fermentum]|uniref:NAD(P)H-dependent oxidoreductase n=1 Tax=Limosilactobacillus fermentum TaxID=1613 RepID=UPI0039BF7195
MKIVILTGSPHHPGTSEQLADAFEKAVRENGHQVYRFDAGRRASEFSLLQLEDERRGWKSPSARMTWWKTRSCPS